MKLAERPVRADPRRRRPRGNPAARRPPGGLSAAKPAKIHAMRPLGGLYTAMVTRSVATAASTRPPPWRWCGHLLANGSDGCRLRDHLRVADADRRRDVSLVSLMVEELGTRR